MSTSPIILLIQFRLRSITCQLEYDSIARELGGGVRVIAMSALVVSDWVGVMTDMNIAGVILGGSGDFDFDGGRANDDPARAQSRQFVQVLSPLLAYLFTNTVPLFGICYGHQLVGAWQGVSVVHDVTQQKMRSHLVTQISSTATHPLCVGLPSQFYAHYGHTDVLSGVPPGASLVMTGGDVCQISAVAYSDRQITTQFHPELTIADLRLRIDATAGYLPEGSLLEELFVEDDASHQLLRNFAMMVMESREGRH